MKFDSISHNLAFPKKQLQLDIPPSLQGLQLWQWNLRRVKNDESKSKSKNQTLYNIELP